MSLPTPNLDDRRFQDIVDEAKQRIPRYCPEWTDHNVSDPGVALIELFAWMTDLTLYRLNQVPDRLYAKFLDLLGMPLRPPAPAKALLVFWLTGSQPDTVRVPAGTQVGTQRSEHDEPVTFMTDQERLIVPPDLMGCVTSSIGGRFEDRWDDLRFDGYSVECFPTVQAGDAVHFGFGSSLAGNVVCLSIGATIEGHGVNPAHPPWAWEAWGGAGWLEASVLNDTTSALNNDGEITLVLPERHEPLTVGPVRAHWLRCRMAEPEENYPGYRTSPRVSRLKVVTLGGVARAHHGEPVGPTHLGRSTGTPGQVFQIQRYPALPLRVDERVIVTDREGEHRWTRVDDFARSGADDRHFVWDGAVGEVRFGPRVRQGDGTYRQYGAVPAIDADVTLSGYRYGGGSRGNVGARTLTVPKRSMPFIGSVENLGPAVGGVDPETVDEAKARGPLWLRSGSRAVTVADFEHLALEASRDVARARCLAPQAADRSIQVLIVPRLTVEPRELVLDDLALPDGLIDEVSKHLDERRILTSTVTIRAAAYQGVTVVARVVGAPGTRPEQLRDRALDALYRYINPLVGGPSGTGWPFDRDLSLGEVFALLAGVEGVVGVEQVRLFLADLAHPQGGDPQDAGQVVRIRPDELLASFRHQVLVRP